MDLNKYTLLESKFTVNYPTNNHATYSSLLNYSNDLNKPFQRWCRYKEGFSKDFVKKIINEYKNDDCLNILDPFAGSGTTILTANEMGFNGYGFEVNPFSFFLMKVKQTYYSDNDVKLFKEAYENILNSLENNQFEDYKLPELSFSNKVFQQEVEKYMMSCKVKILKLQESKIKDLLFLGWLSCIEELSVYRKAGNGLKFRKTVKPIILNKDSVITKLKKQFINMYEDILISKDSGQHSNNIFNETSIDFSRKIETETINGIIFSPPYANCFDYTEIYKLELWFGDFVKSYEDIKKLRSNSLKSHLNRDYSKENKLANSKILNELIEEVKKTKLWAKKIPYMLNGYFLDMFNILDNCYKTLKKNGFCAIVVGNSAYGGIVIPTDLILAEYAESIGFKVDKIEVDRYIITSSQQYEKTKNLGKYLRESVVCLKKIN